MRPHQQHPDRRRPRTTRSTRSTQLLAAGVPVTLNTDNPRVSDTTLSQEHALARHATGTPTIATVAEQSRRFT